MNSTLADLRARADELRNEARRLLADIRLLDLVREQIGTVALVGSVDLDLMVWPDIDICTSLEPSAGERLLALLPPLHRRAEQQGYAIVRVSFNDEYRRPGNPYGRGLYCGMRIAAPGRERMWKVDLWAWDDATFGEKLDQHQRLAAELATADRDLILSIKDAVHLRPEYRDTITSLDVYAFVVQRGGRSVEDFDRFVSQRLPQPDKG